MSQDSLSQEQRLLAMALAMRSAIVDMEARLNRLIGELEELRPVDARLYLPVALQVTKESLGDYDFSEINLLLAIEEATGFSVEKIVGMDRGREVVLARQVTMYMLYRHTSMSYPQIATILGGRDHSTVMHGVRKITKAIKTDLALNAFVSSIQTRFGLNPKATKPLRAKPPKKITQAKVKPKAPSSQIPAAQTPVISQPYWAWDNLKKNG